ncbi:MAG: amidohydrolase family protein [Gammaproteobacteria bacterium]|nr:amidohydrolase family protein [Gammaproteobacteria bacterium]
MINFTKWAALFLLYILPVSVLANSDLIIINAKMINTTEKTMFPREGYIIIHDGKIKKVGFGKIPNIKNSRVYNAKHQYLIPGLIDSHNHINVVPGLADDISHPDLVTEYRKQLPSSYLYFGYTTIIDLVIDKSEIFNSNPKHPDLYTCGGGIMSANGYPMSEFPENLRFKMFPNFLYERNKGVKLPEGINPADHTPSAIIRRIVNSNAKCVKIFYEPGFGASKNLPLPSLDAVRQIVILAHKHHLPVLIHANSLVAQKFVLDSGADIFAHGMWNWKPYDGSPGLPSPIKHMLDQVILRHLGYQPTMQVIQGLQALLDPHFLEDQQLLNVTPRPLLDWYKTKEGQWYTNLIVDGLPKSTVSNRLTSKEDQVSRVVKYIQKNHGNLLFGTDTPSSPTYGNPPGYNGYLEMKDWYQAGVPLSEILISATIRNAKFFHLEKKYGSLSAGKIANLVIMKKNPLNDISAYDSITTVILHGQFYDRHVFSAQ